MRRAAKVDANQSEVIAALRKIGASVQPLHQVGQGCPDLLCGMAGVNVALEIKDGSKPPSERKLTADQAQWHLDWRGQVHTVHSPEQAIAVVRQVVGEVYMSRLHDKAAFIAEMVR